MNSVSTNYPFVTALLVTRNEQNYIERALLSLINQTYPKDCYEIVIIDGESSDDTLKIVGDLVSKYKSDIFNICIINNPKHILSSGWNIGIKAAKGEYVVRIDSHAEAASDFIEKSVETILSVSDAVCVGGKLITKSVDGDNDIISKILSSPFGVGNSSFRVSDKSGYVDTAVYGLYKKEIFEQVGYFNEQYVRDQDLELHSRIRSSGGKFYFNPQIKCVYYCRNTVEKMVKQAFGNGKWNMVLLKNHNSALRLRHLIPFVFVLFLLTSFCFGLLNKKIRNLGLSVILLHFSIGVYAASMKTNNYSEIIKMPFLFFLLHTSYGAGYLSGITTKIEQ